MSESQLPYVTAHGNITKVLEKIKSAETPTRFTQDFLATTLDMPGGSAKPVIPFLKRTGFLGGDGSPTDIYKRFRNPDRRGAAAAEALRTGFKPLSSINEFVHDAKDSAVRGVIVQASGLEENAKVTGAILGSFKALKAFADFSSTQQDEPPLPEDEASGADSSASGDLAGRINFGYTINLHLPPSTDVAVFNAIFKSLKEHLLR